MLEMNKKICSKCEMLKEMAAFYNSKNSLDGKRSSCKACHKVASDKYIKTEKGKDIKKQARAKRNKNYPLMIIAENKVNYAIRSGKIKRKPCGVCHIDKAEAHHCDYSKPLDVMWLCDRHHKEWHRLNEAHYPVISQ